MDPFDTYQHLQALARRCAVPKTTRRHVHLSDRPFVVAAYHLAGEIGAPLAMIWGTSPDPARAGFLAVAEPRNRKERFAALDQFGQAVDAHVGPMMRRHTVQRVSRGRVVGTDEVCLDAPQFVVPNAATAAWLFGVVGRFTRYLPTDGDDAAPETVRRTGQNLTFFDQARQMPGSCLALAATDVLAVHFITGQLDGEMQNLAAVLGWIDPHAGLDGPEAAARAENARPPAGPLPDPTWDADVLQHRIANYHDALDHRRRQRARAELAAEAHAQLEPAWVDTWRALDVLRALPEAAHAPERWANDVRAWTWHAERMDLGTARFRRVPTPLQAARSLNRVEKRTEELAAQMALDDPAVMAGAVARGDAAAGTVVAVDPTRREANANGRTVTRPLVTIDAALPFDRPVGTLLHLASNPSVRAELAARDGQRLVFRVVAGALKASTRRLLPAVADYVVLSPYGPGTFFPTTLPDETPWTHVMPEPAGADV